MVATVNLNGDNTILCGATFTRIFTLLDEATGLPIDLTNKVPRMQLRSAVDSDASPAAAILSLVPASSPPLTSNETGVEVLGVATNGQIKVQISHANTDTLQVDNTLGGVYDLEMEDSVTLVVDRYMEGAWAAVVGVTRG